MMRDAGRLVREIGYAQRAYWRNPSAAFFTFLFPIVMLVVFASILRDVRLVSVAGLRYAQYYVPGIVAFGVISACYTNLAMRMCFFRDLGVLKRIRDTPLPMWIFMGGNVGSCLIVSLLLVVLTTGIGVLFFDVTFAGHVLPLALAVGVGAFCFCALGFAVTVIVPYASAASATVNGLLFPLLVLSGTFFPPPAGSVIERIARLLPIRHFHQAVFTTFNAGAGRSAVDTDALAVMLVWGLAGLAVAARGFRWEPRH